MKVTLFFIELLFIAKTLSSLNLFCTLKKSHEIFVQYYFTWQIFLCRLEGKNLQDLAKKK